jgi:hypothetical protein
LTSVHCYKQTRYRLDWVLPLGEDRSGLSEKRLSLVGDACFGGVAPVRDAAEGVFDRQLIDCVGIVFIRSFFGFSMALVGGVCNRFKPFVEARNSAAILGRSVSFAANEAWIGQDLERD